MDTDGDRSICFLVRVAAWYDRLEVEIGGGDAVGSSHVEYFLNVPPDGGQGWGGR